VERAARRRRLGQLVDGTKSTASSRSAQALMREPDIFVSTVTEKLLTYALGRGLTAADMPAVRAIVAMRSATATGFRRSCWGSCGACPSDADCDGRPEAWPGPGDPNRHVPS
jgi:hypothetical protein